MSIRSRSAIFLVFGAALVLAACGGAAAPPTASPRPTASPQPTPAATPPAESPSSRGVVATFEVEDERYRILLTDPADVEIAQRLLAGDEAPNIPNGLIVRGDPGVNTGYSWHIDPSSVEFADMTMEVCDGVPSFVEDGTLEGDRFCPWDARVVAIEPAQ